MDFAFAMKLQCFFASSHLIMILIMVLLVKSTDGDGTKNSNSKPTIGEGLNAGVSFWKLIVNSMNSGKAISSQSTTTTPTTETNRVALKTTLVVTTTVATTTDIRDIEIITNRHDQIKTEDAIMTEKVIIEDNCRQVSYLSVLMYLAAIFFIFFFVLILVVLGRKRTKARVVPIDIPEEEPTNTRTPAECVYDYAELPKVTMYEARDMIAANRRLGECSFTPNLPDRTSRIYAVPHQFTFIKELRSIFRESTRKSIPPGPHLSRMRDITAVQHQ